MWYLLKQRCFLSKKAFPFQKDVSFSKCVSNVTIMTKNNFWKRKRKHQFWKGNIFLKRNVFPFQQVLKVVSFLKSVSFSKMCFLFKKMFPFQNVVSFSKIFTNDFLKLNFSYVIHVTGDLLETQKWRGSFGCYFVYDEREVGHKNPARWNWTVAQTRLRLHLWILVPLKGLSIPPAPTGQSGALQRGQKED